MNEGKVQLDTSSIGQTRSLFKPGSWLSKIDFVNHLILFNNVLMAVLAENNGGKSSFGQILHSNLDQQIKPITVKITPPFDYKAIITEIATQLHLKQDSDSTIMSLADQINERKAHILLIIDDAHQLSETFIKEAMIAIKNQNEFGFFHVCLLSDYSLVATLNALAVDQFDNLIHSIEIGALNESETRTYVLQRAMASRLINKPLTDVQYKQFYQTTKGNLAKINSSLEDFISKCFNQREYKKSSAPKRISMAISAFLVAGLSYVYYDKIYEAAIKPTNLVSIITPKPEQKKFESRNSEHQIAATSYIASWQDSSTRQFIQYALPKKQFLDEISDEREEISHVAVVDKVVVIPTLKPRNTPTELDKFNLAEQIKTKSIEMAKAKTAESTLPKFALLGRTHSTVKSQIKAERKGVYTIQLVASHRISDVQRFKNSSKHLANSQVRHFKNNKGVWYILTIGEYDNRNSAQSNIKKLPPELAKLNPWIRSVSGLENIG